MGIKRIVYALDMFTGIIFSTLGHGHGFLLWQCSKRAGFRRCSIPRFVLSKDTSARLACSVASSILLLKVELAS